MLQYYFVHCPYVDTHRKAKQNKKYIYILTGADVKEKTAALQMLVVCM